MIKPISAPPPDPSIEDLIAGDVTANMTQAFTDAMIGNISIQSNGTGPTVLMYDDYSMTMQQSSIDSLLKLAEENLVQAVETVTKDQIATIDEDEFKKRSKDVLTKKMQQEIIKKTKFTMLTDPREQTIVTRAKVYVFSEQDLRFFIENLVKNS